MKTRAKISVLLVLLSCGLVNLDAQTDFSKFEIGFNAGVFVYQGDLTRSPLGSYRTLKPGVNLYINHLLNRTFSLRTNLVAGALKGDDARYSHPEYRRQRNFIFKSPAFELSELIVADLLKNNFRAYKGLSPYVFVGVGINFLNTKRDWSRFNSEYFSGELSTLEGLAADQQHSPPNVIPVLPAGIGIRYALSKKISLSAETTYRFVFTDYLDGFSKAANDSRKDSYHTHMIGVVYQFQKPSSLKCPAF